MYCYECGKEILEGSKFCLFCGASLLNITNNVADTNATDESSETTESVFCMTIQDVFNISERGTVIIGTVESGQLKKGQNVKILDYGDTVYSVAGIEKNRNVVDSAKSGETIGVLLPELDKTNDIKGKKLVSQNDEAKADDAPDYEKIFGFAGPMSSSGFLSSESESSNTACFKDNVKTYLGNEYSAPNQNVLQQQQGQYQGIPEIKATVTLKTGKGITVFSTLNLGSLMVSSNGVMFTMNIGNSANNHSYSFEEIADAQFSITRGGLTPFLSYDVTLKDGRKYIYMYAMLEKGKLNSIDAIIKNNITK